MTIVNIHSRHIPATLAQVSALLQTVGSTQDSAWPHEDWMPMQLDRPLQKDAVGGHGPIRYRVAIYEPLSRIRFEFTSGSQGYHELTLQATSEQSCLLTHTIRTEPTVKFRIAWLLIIRWMHDALIEDLFDKVQSQLAALPKRQRWNAYVRFLRKQRGWSITSANYPAIYADEKGATS